MKTRQQHLSALKPIVLVLLLYVFASFISGFISHQGFSKTLAEFGFRFVLVASGLILFLAHTENTRAGWSIRANDLLFAAGVGTGLAAAEVCLLLWRAAQDSNLQFAKLPGFSEIALQQILGATSEELLFVGFLYAQLRRRLSILRATAIVAVIFVLLHWPSNVLGVMTRAVYILVACSLFERCRSIALNIALHIAVNGCGFVAVLMIGDHLPPALAFPQFAALMTAASSLAVVTASIRYAWSSPRRPVSETSSPS